MSKLAYDGVMGRCRKRANRSLSRGPGFKRSWSEVDREEGEGGYDDERTFRGSVGRSEAGSSASDGPRTSQGVDMAMCVCVCACVCVCVCVCVSEIVCMCVCA